VIFTIAISFLLIGLTNKQFGDWTDPTVGGFILIGLIGSAIFAFVESRAKEPIVPLDLWKSRAYSASMVSIFFAAFAFFGAIVFLPRWFQVVEGFSPTNSGLAALPLVIGLIFSSIASGVLVARTGRYKFLLVGAIALLGVATALMTQLTKDTPLPIVWFWMFLAGLGVGPTFSVFTIVIQNSVPFRQMGVATSNLTFFRQIGGSVALAFVGTIFADAFENDLVPQMTAAGVPSQIVQGFQQGQGTFDINNLTGVGNLGNAILAAVPPQFVEVVRPFVPNIIEGIHGAFSLAVGQTFYLGVFGAVVAAIAALAMKELPLRASNAAPVARAEAQAQGQAAAVKSAPAAD